MYTYVRQHFNNGGRDDQEASTHLLYMVQHPPLTFGKGFDEKKHKPICSPGCRDAEKLFSMMFSDEEINRRAHYYSLTKGDTDDRRLGA